ncbi:MAG: GNAT family N-acetyltransferase [Bacillota bacterium]|nr:GNAT family N-acetyltransferase [Bacillota bacterium]
MDQVVEIYKENQWTSYLGDQERLKKAFENSLYILGAFDGDKLLGFVRCLGDTEFILYVQDLIVRPAYQRQGLGRQLMKKVSAAYPHVRQFILITDKNDEKSNGFYKAIGMTEDLFGFPCSTYFRKQEIE